MTDTGERQISPPDMAVLIAHGAARPTSPPTGYTVPPSSSPNHAPNVVPMVGFLQGVTAAVPVNPACPRTAQSNSPLPARSAGAAR